MLLTDHGKDCIEEVGALVGTTISQALQSLAQDTHIDYSAEQRPRQSSVAVAKGDGDDGANVASPYFGKFRAADPLKIERFEVFGVAKLDATVALVGSQSHASPFKCEGLQGDRLLWQNSTGNSEQISRDDLSSQWPDAITAQSLFELICQRRFAADSAPQVDKHRGERLARLERWCSTATNQWLKSF